MGLWILCAGFKSRLGPLFTIISRPTEESRALGKEKKEYAERHFLRREFWTQLLDKVKDKTRLHSNLSPTIASWISAGAGKSGIAYTYVITNKYAKCKIYLDRGKDFVDNKLCIISPEVGAPMCFDYEFSNGGNRLTLTMGNEYGSWRIVLDRI